MIYAVVLWIFLWLKSTLVIAAITGLLFNPIHMLIAAVDTVKRVCNTHLNNKIYYLWFIQ